MSIIFVFVCYDLGYHNDDLNYHICTGRTPEENIKTTLWQIGLTKNDSSAQKWFIDGSITDPLEVYSNLLSLVILLLTCQIYWYAVQIKTNSISQVMNYVKCFSFAQKTINAQHLKDKFKETKSKILGNGISLLFLFLCLVALIPHYVAKVTAKRDINEVNYGWTRALVYIEMMTLTFITIIVCPMLLIYCNLKMKKSLVKEIKDKKLVKWITQLYYNL